MNISFNKVSNKYFILGIKYLLENNIVNVGYNSSAPLFFIEADNITIIKLESLLSKDKYYRQKFIISSRKTCYPIMEVALKYNATVLFKEDSINELNLKIKKMNSSYYIHKKLSKCQRQVIDLLEIGMKSVNIAKKMNLSPKTISHHKRSAMKIMGVSTNIELYKLFQLNNK